MKLHLGDGRLLGGADAAIVLARYIWWLWPVWLLAQLPGMRPVIRRVYRTVAKHRHCLGDTCRRRERAVWIDWLPLAALPLVTLFFRNQLAAWSFMWWLAFAIFLGCKWFTWRQVVNPAVHPLRSIAYLLAWPGMDAKAFLAPRRDRGASRHPSARRPHASGITLSDGSMAFMKTIVGAVLLAFAAGRATTSPTLLLGWIGMLGVVLFLHFGIFHLLALVWKGFGLDVTPVMRSPLRAASLAAFWGERWNTAFHRIAHDQVFRPLTRCIGPRWAIMAVFVISGFVHDLLISLPARAGYGLPTAYFTLQGAAVLFERAKPGRMLGLGRGVTGWLFMFAITVAPAYGLFHPPFIHNVILPMLQTLGATWHSP